MVGAAITVVEDSPVEASMAADSAVEASTAVGASTAAGALAEAEEGKPQSMNISGRISRGSGLFFVRDRRFISDGGARTSQNDYHRINIIVYYVFVDLRILT